MTYTNEKRFNIYSYFIIFLFTLILVLRWKWMPTFIDIYYHLLTTLNFQKAGGITALSFWEYAPYGRPHLYPPLLHMLMLAVFKLKLNILTVARIFELLSFPLLLVTMHITIKRVFNLRLAFWSVLVSVSMYSFYLSCINFLAATLALCLGLLAFLSIERHRLVAATVFVALMFYSHVSIAFFLFSSLFIYGLLKRERLRPILTISLFALIGYLPFLIHQLRYLSFFEPQRVSENFPFELNIIVYSLSLLGLFLAVKKKKKYSFFIACFLASLFFLPLRYRFFSGQGMIGVVFLAALSLDFLYNRLYAQAVKRNCPRLILIYFLFIFLGIFLISPSISINGKEIKFNFLGSTYVNIFPTPEIRGRSNELSIYIPKVFEPLFEIIDRYSTPEDLITSNHEYLAGFISVFTDRATSSAMLPEIKPFREFNPFRYAKLIIWLKNPQDTSWEPEDLIEKLGLIKIAQTDVFFIYENPRASFSSRDSQAVVSFSLSSAILFTLLAAAVIDLNRKRN